MATIIVSFDEYYPTKGQWQQSLLVLMNITLLSRTMAIIIVSFDEYYPAQGQWQQSLLVLMNITPLRDNGNNHC